jgi:hypothetical protein
MLTERYSLPTLRSRHRVGRIITLFALVALVPTGCGSTDAESRSVVVSSPPSPAGSSPGTDRILISVQRSGGIAGVHDIVEVHENGGWVATRKSGQAASGRLTSDQSTALRALLGEAWRAEAARSPKHPCPDGFVYLVTADMGTARTDDCALVSQPIMAKLTTAVLSGAGL